MQRIRLGSSAITHVGYDPVKKRLEVEFRNGGVYAYSGVARTEFEDLLRAESAGEFINRRIKPKHLCVTLRRSPPPLV
jgi:hypothetical protein